MTSTEIAQAIGTDHTLVAVGFEALATNARVEETKEFKSMTGRVVTYTVTRTRHTHTEGIDCAITAAGLVALGVAFRAAVKHGAQLWRIDRDARVFTPWSDIETAELTEEGDGVYQLLLVPWLGRPRSLLVAAKGPAGSALEDLVLRIQSGAFPLDEARKDELIDHQTRVEALRDDITAAIEREPYFAAMVAAPAGALVGLPGLAGFGVALLVLVTDFRRHLLAGKLDWMMDSVEHMVIGCVVGLLFAVPSLALFAYAAWVLRRSFKARGEAERKMAEVGQLLELPR